MSLRQVPASSESSANHFGLYLSKSLKSTDWEPSQNRWPQTLLLDYCMMYGYLWNFHENIFKTPQQTGSFPINQLSNDPPKNSTSSRSLLAGALAPAPDMFQPQIQSMQTTHSQTHTGTYLYIYIYIQYNNQESCTISICKVILPTAAKKRVGSGLGLGVFRLFLGFGVSKNLLLTLHGLWGQDDPSEVS